MGSREKGIVPAGRATQLLIISWRKEQICTSECAFWFQKLHVKYKGMKQLWLKSSEDKEAL